MLEFSVYCCNHIIVPLMQNLLRETLTSGQQPGETIDEMYMFLKSWLEMFDKHIMKNILVYYEQREKVASSDGEKFHSISLLMKQTFWIYIECLSGKYHDLISILALSSIRYDSAGFPSPLIARIL